PIKTIRHPFRAGRGKGACPPLGPRTEGVADVGRVRRFHQPRGVSVMPWNSWMASLRALVLGPTRVSSPGPRGCSPSRYARVGLEALEDRFAPASASFTAATGLQTGATPGATPAYTLVDGNLYHNTASEQQLIDTGVKSFTVVQDQIYDLHLN